MKIPWWLHRILMGIFIPSGMIGGAILALYSINIFDNYLGRGVVVLYPLCIMLGGIIPHIVFRRWIHAACPVDAERMIIERISLPKRYREEIERRASRYCCPICGITK